MISLSKVIEATKGIVTGGGKDLLFNGVTTDTRSACQGDLFIALAGENFDGHDYCETALNNSRVIQERKQAKKGMKVYPKLLV